LNHLSRRAIERSRRRRVFREDTHAEPRPISRRQRPPSRPIYFIGIPEQDAASVWATVDYCEKLLRKFKGRRVLPMLCPMIPLLDPASTFSERPEEHGYRLFARSLQEHRQLLGRASLVNRINYEDKWLKRNELVTVGYSAVRALAGLKSELGLFPAGIANSVTRRIADALGFIDVVHRADCIADPGERARELDKVSSEIPRRNHAIFFRGVDNHAFSVGRQIGGRWFDEIPSGVETSQLNRDA
jgi:clorobiocin/coumermycin A biosynthesis protein CloN6/CouN6